MFDSGRLVQGDRVADFERQVAARVGRKHAVAVANGTAALQLALVAIGVRQGDEVLVPDLTWPSPGHAVLALGALPLLVDVDAAEWNATADLMAAARTPRTRAAIVIDQFGCPSRTRAIAAALPDLPLIVDSACSLGSHDGERPCGAAGVIACLSFHPRKVVTTGEGGMCLTDDAGLAAKLHELRNHGQGAPGVFVRASGNYRLTEMGAAIGIVQLATLDDMISARAAIAARYSEAFGVFAPQRLPEGARSNHQTYGIVLPEHVQRSVVIAAMRERGVETGRLSYALHTLPQFSAAARAAGARSFPVASMLAERGLALPLWPGLLEEDQVKVIETLRSVLAS